jgi:IS30 family transposase
MVDKNHKSAVLVITDRKSRFNKLRKLNGKYARKVKLWFFCPRIG